MGFVGPQHMLCFIVAICTVVFSIIVLGIDGYLNNSGACAAVGLVGSNVFCSATALGITAGVLGLLLGLLAIFWLLVTELWDIGILRFVIVIGMFLVAVLAFVSGVLNAIEGQYSHFAAAAAFSFFLMVTAVLTGVFGWMARGGGTSSA
jgi:hypothetical protein